MIRCLFSRSKSAASFAAAAACAAAVVLVVASCVAQSFMAALKKEPSKYG